MRKCTCTLSYASLLTFACLPLPPPDNDDDAEYSTDEILDALEYVQKVSNRGIKDNAVAQDLRFSFWTAVARHYYRSINTEPTNQQLNKFTRKLKYMRTCLRVRLSCNYSA